MLAGPTAVGKTEMALALAQRFRAPILSADSRQFYKELNIGTAKPDKIQLKAAEHHFINNKHIGELYGAGHYERDAIGLLDQIFTRHDLAIMAGGSGLYIQAVLEGVDELPEAPRHLRKKLNEEYKEKGLSWLQAEVKRLDPEFYKKADRENPQRLLRALEVCLSTGATFSGMHRKKKTGRNFIPIRILLNIEREELYKRINERVDRMMKDGLLDEVRSVAAFREENALKTVGYKELFDYLDGKHSLESAVEKIRQHTRNYAKRQLTWFRNKGEYKEMKPDPAALIKYIEQQMDG